MFVPLYLALIGPHLEYSIQVSSPPQLPPYNTNVYKVEQVQWSPQRRWSGLDKLPSEERLRELGLFSLEKRWL